MQRIILALAAMAMMFGCAPRLMSHGEWITISATDLKSYNDSGFLYTPYSYSGKYKPIGVVFATMYPSAQFEEATVLDGDVSGCGCWRIGAVSQKKVLDSLFRWARSEGADAIVDLRTTNAYSPFSKDGLMVNQGAHITGFAIKRLD